jgi:hypothetical protein
MPAFTKAMLDKLGLTPAATTLQAVPQKKKAKRYRIQRCTTRMPFIKLILSFCHTIK